VLDNDGVGAARRLAGDRELLRESVRLLYVTLTRAKGALVIPWCAGSPQEDDSFGDLWGMDPGALDPLPEPARPSVPPEAADASAGINGFSSAWSALPMAPRAFPVGDGADPLDYGVWWHETLEFLPWNGSGDEVAAHGAASLERAAQLGFGQRAGEEWDRLLASEPWRLMRDPRWTRLAEVGVFAPLGPDRWIDGVIDLVLRDESADELWIVDWKTNRRTAQEDDRALLLRLSADYEGQLSAYGSCASGFFGGANVALWVYSTVAGNWIRAGGRP
jgi:hypothetical protein